MGSEFKSTARRKTARALTEEEARASTRKWCKSWLSDHNVDPTKWVVANAREFDELIRRGLDADGLKKYLKDVFRIELERGSCQHLLRKMERELVPAACIAAIGREGETVPGPVRADTPPELPADRAIIDIVPPAEGERPREIQAGGDDEAHEQDSQ